MPRPRKAPSTALGEAMTARRGARTLQDLGAEVGVTYATLSRIERGAHRPTYDTAVRLAAWLGWTTDQVMQAADKPGSDTLHNS